MREGGVVVWRSEGGGVVVWRSERGGGGVEK